MRSVMRGVIADERRRGLAALIVFTFFMVVGFTMVIPLVAVHFVDNIGLAAGAVGLALGIRQLAQQGLALVSGVLTDRFGARRLIRLGVLVRAVGFAWLGWSDDLPTLTLALVLTALGGALFEVPYQTAIAALTTEEDRVSYYSLSNTVSGAATALGPLMGSALILFDFRLVCLAAAACFGLTFVIALFVLPPVVAHREIPQNLSYGLGLVRQDGRFLLLTFLLMGYWFTALQMYISFPLRAEDLTGTASSVGVMFALNAGMSVVLQYPVVRLLERWLAPGQILVTGVLVMGLGAASVIFAGNFPVFLGSVALFSFGAILTRPTQQTIVASMADTRALGAYMGVGMMAMAFGGGAGNFVGGWLVDVSRNLDWASLPWLVFASVAVLSASGLIGMRLGRKATGDAMEQEVG